MNRIQTAPMPEFDLSHASPSIRRLVGDIERASRAGQIRFLPDGTMQVLADVNVTVGGAFTSAILRHELVQRAVDEGDAEFEAFARARVAARGHQRTGQGYLTTQESRDANLVPDAGVNHFLDVALPIAAGFAQVTAWYIGCFKSNSTPAAGWLSNWAGASSGPLATELAQADFDEVGRQLAVFAAASAKVKATSAASVFTFASGTSGISLYGAALNSIATLAYNSTDKALLAATRFATAKTGLGATDKANVSYTITGSST